MANEPTAGALLAQLLKAPKEKRKEIERQFLAQSSRQLGGVKVSIDKKKAGE